MLEKFWESLGSDLGKKWLERVFSPAFIFWVGGFGAWMVSPGLAGWQARWDEAWNWVNGQQPMMQGALAVGMLILVVLSSLIMETLRYPFLRLLEGYWPGPLRSVAQWAADLRGRFIQRDREAWQKHKLKEMKEPLSGIEKRRLAGLESKLHYVPAVADERMPFSLGDILRSGESASYYKYGLDAVACWPRLWLLLPDNVRKDLGAARQALDQRVELLGWGLLFVIWSFWSLWSIPVSLVWLLFAYALCKQAAKGYADLIEAAFDMFRWELYKAARLPVPTLGAEEKAMGLKLSAYYWRGESAGLSFQHPSEKQS